MINFNTVVQAKPSKAPAMYVLSHSICYGTEWTDDINKAKKFEAGKAETIVKILAQKWVTGCTAVLID